MFGEGNEVKGICDTQGMQEFLTHKDFNLEEKLFINRIMFLLLKEKRQKLSFVQFMKHLKILQYGNFEQKVILFFKMVDENDNFSISWLETKKFFMQSFLQEISQD